LDKRIAWKARDTGADLKEGFEVGKKNPTLDSKTGLWTVTSSEVGIILTLSLSVREHGFSNRILQLLHDARLGFLTHQCL